MMEPSNLDNQLSGSSSFGTPSSHLHSGSHEWSPTGLILNTDQFNLNATEVLSNPEIPNTSMVQDLGLHWPYRTESYTNHSSHQVNCLTKIKEEPPGSFIKFVSKIKEPSTLDHSQLSYSLGHDNLLNARYPAGFHTSTPCSERGNYGVVLPTANISGTDMSTFTSPFSNSEFQGANFPAPIGNHALFREIGGFGMGCSQKPAQEPQESHHERSSVVDGIKRGNSASDANGSSTQSAKKPRIESRSSISPFKVRKEKLGDRIAALQQLVAPFGKTDTASVLMEAIVYIKFLQDQVQTLSVPYMKSSSGNKHGTSHGVSSEEKDQESKQDLRSRGLCLVPLSSTSYVTNGNLGIWASQNSKSGF